MTCFSGCFGHQYSSPRPRQTVDDDVTKEISNIQDAKLYSYTELERATNKFSVANKIGEGGFGSVYKGELNNGTLAALKVLSAKSEQGAREFLNEVVALSGLEHENLVKLYGCCTEGQHRILVYGYLENNSLSQTLLSGRYDASQFSWSIRTKICIGVAEGLAFLHHVVWPHIVHRDIKASNILLDRDFTPKISDFGLAKLFPSTATHISTRIAGTYGYLAPEYAIRGRLTRKADIYSFGILLIEIVTGRSNTNKRLPSRDQYLLERTWGLYEQGNLEQLVDTALEGNFDADEACRFLKIGLMCTQDLPKRRPSMPDVVKMLNGEKFDMDEGKISRPGLIMELMNLRGSTSENNPLSSEVQSNATDLSTVASPNPMLSD
ncbi:cold-responsive protein kinase 1-like isoform X2 [Andrographis paniculata]|uniref:cold-responsive protein kinase 1-like isoform X2 n=1 Tax=Andrographis paniculata TaxID=175694 RepID=UPI0021E6F7DF|nr:cold-responsive protein kinase 1-like isoform X2 [Andrographis paniculata]XP_051114644.1 cold-responsive protein kinase 1-like isoform X2 [Andrographis paniculata]XP_051114645.1 cold-responsive protein kinase 1-like isoform X2 [Andrographis paniculata]XP_051114646.1 cold-responsive protein kinase 1-like isoform X2 [Andrographis paniculata]XP_051114647.1 cold-responsive protein kinase 1-like isoform X2 [Andrographis paniculata]XP_051114648.1 cold-responsive protein kinase 1-like isoform X2 [